MAKDYVVTPPFRVSFPAVFEPRGFEDQEPKYSVTMMFPKETNLKELEDLVSAVAEEKWGKKVKKFRTPFRDGDEKEREEYTGQILVNAKSKTKPTIVDQRKRPITSEEDFYPGCWARAALT